MPLPQVRDKVFELLQMVDGVHRTALERLVGFLRAQSYTDAVEQAATDPMIRTLLLLYDLLPDDAPEQMPALRNGSPPLGKRSATVIPLEVVSQPQPHPARRLDFKSVAQLEEVPPGAMRAFDVAGLRVLVANVDGELYVVRTTCLGSMAPLELGQFTPPIITCPWHRDSFDIRTGKRADGTRGADLVLLPITVADGKIQVAV